ncbi:hypothetical protein Vadar_014609 [Vaccinium darrowii]|uniref:Uncharacterized protein n=1 Tax=Vaccinium darrowii TaxID=229202 RepID=A0ACB7X9Z7_9ERIC|nr:hypothetical protein Vadar_014609 [Vaccinium darrowii]
MESPANVAASLESAGKIILRWDSTASEEARDRMIFDGDRHEIDVYLTAVDEIQRWMESATLADDQNKANTAIQIAMAWLEDEFRNLLISHIDQDSRLPWPCRRIGTVPQNRLELRWNNARSVKSPSSSGKNPAISPWLRSMLATVV